VYNFLVLVVVVVVVVLHSTKKITYFSKV